MCGLGSGVQCSVDCEVGLDPYWSVWSRPGAEIRRGCQCGSVGRGRAAGSSWSVGRAQERCMNDLRSWCRKLTAGAHPEAGYIWLHIRRADGRLL